MPKLLKFWLLLILLKLLTNCASVPPDVYVFENLQQHLSTDPITGHLILKPSPACWAKIGEVECGHGVAGHFQTVSLAQRLHVLPHLADRAEQHQPGGVGRAGGNGASDRSAQ